MYINELPENVKTTTLVKIIYDCCGKGHVLKYKDAQKNYNKNKEKHICRPCWLKSDANPAKNATSIAKAKKTNLDRYGCAVPLNSKENIEKRNAEIFTPERLAIREKKRKTTNIEKYGVDHPMKCDIGKDAVKKTMQEKYGVDHPYQSAEIMEKMRAKNKENYGVENVAQLPEVQDKMQETTEQRYGVKHYNQLPHMRDYLRENCKEWLADAWANPWAKGIVRPEEWNRKQSESMARKILSGEFNPEDKRFYLTGWYTSVKCKKHRAYFRSSLELCTHYLLDNDKDVILYENEPFAIRYEKSPGIIRNYIPDFFVARQKKCLVIEVKPAFRMREENVVHKVQVGEAFAEANGFKFIYLDEKHIDKYCNLSSEKIQLLDNVEILKKKTKPD